jgi:UDP-glucose 4-epimerase
MKTSIVTGGAGFIGSNLAKRLIEKGEKVIILDDLSTGFLKNIPDGAAFYQVDVSNLQELLHVRFPEKIDTIFHFAAQSSGEASFDDPSRDIDVNYRSTYNMLKFADIVKAERFIYSSSMSVYGEVDLEVAEQISENHDCNPSSYYGCNKLASEKLIGIYTRESNIKPTIFRFFNVYGPGQNMHNLKQGMVSIYMSFLMKDIPITVKGSLDRFRDFVYVDDVTDAVLKSVDSLDMYYGIYNLGTGMKTTVYELLMAILNAFGKDDFKKWVRVEGNTPGDIKGFVADMTKLKKVLNWSHSYDIKTGIHKMKSWIDETKEFWRGEK